ncbi:methyl-accepting chemotaxis protein [Neorhizobium sp. JUb45]|uniref:methyl-accepting chemotaxis protein n=1 Tax=Neorhizobium sp. JUb45 TaxID=2485113 RepID=UPI0010441496|nr:methyl-accepting chemotaxis protein [Neorhizobium sp. JUb45]TCR03086.1 methyl-accepting chemotaxis protein [Neorhizobium sp. JUb45]
MTDTNIRSPLWIKITGYGFAAVLFASAAIGGLAWYRQADMSDKALYSKAASDLEVIQTDMAAIQRSASALALTLSGEPDLAGYIANNDRQALLNKFSKNMATMKEVGGLQIITIGNAKGDIVARIHSPEKFGDNVIGRRKTIQAAVSTGKLAAGIEPGKNGIGIYAVAPVIVDGTVVGVVDIGTELSNAYFNPLANRLGAEISVNVTQEGKLTNQSSTQGGNPFLPAETIQAAFDGKEVFEPATLGGRDMLVKAVPFKSFSGDKIGVFEIGTDTTEIAAAARSALWTMLGVTLATSIIALTAFFLFAKSLGNAIGRLTSTMGRLAAGDLNAQVEGESRPDETGAMARAVQVFKDNALKTKELERQADEQRNMTEEQRRQNAEEARLRAEQMAEATNGLATGLQHLSAGNLAYQLDRPFAEDFESLRANFNAAVSQLRGTLGSVAQATSAIDSGSREVSQSADDLSKRTEQQAASLEETAAALDQITVNVSNSSKRAEEARTVAIQANESARQSGAVVANAVQAMGRIEESSGQISNIIGVIDDIAFQTNLLALNAGVEAARAGEAGKGFAVVAQEVRELAQRSANAAKEIKDLIGKSSIEVGTGVKLVRETGEALRTIESHIVTINQHMDSIATSSREQSVGLSEVNTAVNQMDQVTQQNAAMVEEANAAGATLATEAGRLRELISQFQLGQNAASTNPASALRQTAAVMAASPRSTPKASPARGMVGKIAQAFTGRGGAATAAATDNWEEF